MTPVSLANDTDAQMEGLAGSAMGALRKYFADPNEHTEKSIKEARVAGSVLATWSRHMMTKSARESLTFQMARELANDKKELERYVAVAFPTSPFVKKLKA